MTKERQEQIRSRLREIETNNQGRLTPDAVVSDAKDPNSPLHDEFDWDVEAAAHRHWIERARELITSVRVTVTTEHSTVSTVYYVRDPSAAQSEQGYVSLYRLRSDTDMAREAIADEFARAAAVLRRARALAVALRMEDAVDALLDGVDVARRAALETARPG